MTEINNYAGEANPKDIKLSDPTVLRSVVVADPLEAVVSTVTRWLRHDPVEIQT